MSIRKRMNVLLGALLLTGSLFSQNVCVTTPKTSLILSAPIGGELKHVYYGNKLSETDLQNIDFAGTPNMPAYPVYGLNCPGESALAVKHADGNMTLQMEIVQTRTVKEGNAEVTVIEMKDKVYPFYVNVCYRTYQMPTSSKHGPKFAIRKRNRSRSISLPQVFCLSAVEKSGYRTYTVRGPMKAVYVRNCWNRE